MSFFGLGHDQAKPGFSQTTDPFAALQGGEDDNVSLEFEDTYDGLGDKLDETDDAFNDDTFGDRGGTAPTGKPDFDFFGQTAKVADAISEEQVRYSRQQPTGARTSAPTAPAVSQMQHFSYGGMQASNPALKPARTGYEKYREPEQVPDMEVDASIWGVAPKKHHQQTQSQSQIQPPQPVAQPQPSAPAASSGINRKVLSLEEVEAQMRAQAKASHQPTAAIPPAASTPTHIPAQPTPDQVSQGPGGWSQEFAHQFAPPLHHEQLHMPQGPTGRGLPQMHRGTPPVSGPSPFAPQHQHQQSRQHQPPGQQHQQHMPAHKQPQMMQQQRRMQGNVPAHPGHRPQGSYSGQAPVPQQPSHGASADPAQLEQDAKRAKRNHKIFQMSRDNGLMTPSDKNFVSRIQLQQLVAATGNPNEQSNDDVIEDFYFQVLSQIRGGQRQNPNQPLNNFAQTYLFQTGNRYSGMRRHGRIAENHMQRMEQQVQRAVEAAKTKPKNKQLVIEGSLGKISFSNAKTPKPLLNIKRTESGSSHHPKPHTNTIDRKEVLKTIEQVYTTLMELEDLERKQPLPMAGENPELTEELAEFHEKNVTLLNRLWDELKFHEPIGATPIHPFIAFLAFSKGKKAIPRIFRLLNDEQRKILLTMIIVHLDQLDVIRMGAEPDAPTRDAIELFSAAVMPPLFQFFNSADMNLAIGVIGIIIRNVNVELVTRSRIGISFLTMILSRPELVKNSGETDEQSWQEWVRLYNMFFDRLEPCLPFIFPGTVHAGEDIYVWQFLAAIGVGASPEQQQRLVIAVKDRVMETVTVAKTLPASMASQRLAHVNLFMRSIGLDVELLG
ncbi:DNA topoisomerase 2-associated protein pat1 [Zalerion maritima]|uniref:DNA topoisomerase 2-associated protein pat1 n=1 Tax=Zalerion maritima TaxID=339359 RepID=A0AAD5WP73_9PEZI|nr:DNA topoisomerase 2-associated protein pat1 [Zalerion maritima]